MTHLLTKEGLKKLQDEYDERVTAVRQRIANAIKEAKEQGDLSENAEYAEAKREQTENETRIAVLETMIKDATVVTHNKRVKGVQIGSHVTVACRNMERSFEIVGTNEVDPEKGKISVESPFGKALVGRNEGETVTVETPGGAMKCTITTLD